MHLRTLASLAAVAAVVVFSPTLASAESQQFDLDNNTGHNLKSFSMSPKDANNWTDVALEQGATMANGAELLVAFPRGLGDTCEWDMKGTFDDDSSHVWPDVNLCTASKVTLNYDEGTQTPSATTQ
jgi:hypothetical protein